MGDKVYASDLSDVEWQYVEPLLPVPKATGRPRRWSLRSILNAIFYLVRSGCAWRHLPHQFPPWPTVHDYYRRWCKDGTWERLHTHIRQFTREMMSRDATPSAAVLDSQSVKSTEKGALLARAPSAMMGTRRSRAASVICW